MPSSTTVTGKLGPATSVTSQVTNNVNSINFDFDTQTLTVRAGNTTRVYDVTSKTSLTFTVSSGSYSLTVA